MRINDAVWGALLLLLAAALLVHIQSFPTIPNQEYGPALMPGVVAIGLAACGVLLILKGLVARRSTGAAWLEAQAWMRMPRRLLALAVAIGMNVFYIYAVDWLGFVITGTIYLASLFAVFGVKPVRIVPMALVVTIVIHYAFYKLLRVPLPWGILHGIAWF
jgi:putative tricarboxylic transport membrane protein